MNQIKKVEEYKSPDMSFFTTEAERLLCNSFSNLYPYYNGFNGEENL